MQGWRRPVAILQLPAMASLPGALRGTSTGRSSSLAAVKTAIEKQDGAQFAAARKTMTESCDSCRRAAGRPFIRPMPANPVQSIMNMDVNATWPQ